jgi:hypothetical protein
MKKPRRRKGKLALEWKEEKYSPLVFWRTLPHTGETKIISASHPKSSPSRSPEKHRPAA